MANNQFKVTITEKGSAAALPAIWYGGKAGKSFTVIKSVQWPSFYEVVTGKFTGKIIDPKDCKK